MKKLLFLAFVATFFSNNTIAGNICAGTRQQKQQKTILPAADFKDVTLVTQGSWTGGRRFPYTFHKEG